MRVLPDNLCLIERTRFGHYEILSSGGSQVSELLASFCTVNRYSKVHPFRLSAFHATTLLKNPSIAGIITTSTGLLQAVK